MHRGRRNAERNAGLGDFWDFLKPSGSLYDYWVKPSWLDNTQNLVNQLASMQPRVSDPQQSQLLAQLLGMGKSYLSNYQNGITTDNSVVAQWADSVTQFLQRLGTTSQYASDLQNLPDTYSGQEIAYDTAYAAQQEGQTVGNAIGDVATAAGGLLTGAATGAGKTIASSPIGLVLLIGAAIVGIVLLKDVLE